MSATDTTDATGASGPDSSVARCTWGVVPLSAEHPSDTDAMVGLMDRGLLGHGLAEHGSLVVMAASSPAGERRRTC